jgi:glycosyltransferase involved in cell wall biosynthesis
MSDNLHIPRVSLGLPVYNGENYLERAVKSLLAQDLADFELVIVDNASTDATARICAAFAAHDPRVRYFRNERNLGAAANFNLAFRHSRAPYFKWCAHDDFITPNFLTETVKVLDAHSDCVVAVAHFEEIDENDRPTGNSGYDVAKMQGLDSAERFALLVELHGLDAALFGLWRRDAAERTSLHVPYYSSDRSLLAEMALLGTFLKAGDATLFNREHDRRATHLHYKDRTYWQDTTKGGARSLEMCPRLWHLVRIAWRHRQRAPLRRTLPFLLTWALRPHQAGRIALEAVGLVSPQARMLLRRLAAGYGTKLHDPAGQSPAR